MILVGYFRYFRFFETNKIPNEPTLPKRNGMKPINDSINRMNCRPCSRNEVVHAGGDGNVQDYTKEEDVFEWHREKEEIEIEREARDVWSET